MVTAQSVTTYISLCPCVLKATIRLAETWWTWNVWSTGTTRTTGGRTESPLRLIAGEEWNGIELGKIWNVSTCSLKYEAGLDLLFCSGGASATCCTCTLQYI